MIYTILPYLITLFIIATLGTIVLTIIAGKKIYELFLELLQKELKQETTQQEIKTLKTQTYKALQNAWQEYGTEEDNKNLKKALLSIKKKLKLTEDTRNERT